MNLSEYKEKLKKHDWYYHQSDDPRWYDQGQAEEKELVSFAEKYKTYKKAYDKEKAKYFPERAIRRK